MYDQILGLRSSHFRICSPSPAQTTSLVKYDYHFCHIPAVKGSVLVHQSWGGYLVFSHALQKPKGLKALINADGIADWARFSVRFSHRINVLATLNAPQVQRGCAEWIEQLPEKERHILQDGIRNGT